MLLFSFCDKLLICRPGPPSLPAPQVARLDGVVGGAQQVDDPGHGARPRVEGLAARAP